MKSSTFLGLALAVVTKKSYNQMHQSNALSIYKYEWKLRRKKAHLYLNSDPVTDELLQEDINQDELYYLQPNNC